MRRRAEMSLGGMGFDLAASVGVAVLLGWWIDNRYETAPWGILICAMVGIIGGLLNFVRAGQAAARRASADAENKEHDPDE
jgi:F0F1-type ATP synthase assembly protein I